MTMRMTGAGWLTLCATLTLPLASGLDGPARADSTAPQYWSAQLRNTAYFFEQAEPGTDELQARMPFYSQLDAGAGGFFEGKLDLRFSGRYADDAQYDGGVPEEGKWFIGYARLRLEPWHTQIRAGRQFIQEGTIFATVDGGWVSVRPSARLTLDAWAGSTAPGTREFEFGDDFRFGGRGSWMASRQLRFGAWVEQHSRDGQTLALPIGGEVFAQPQRSLRTLARGSWDADREELERLDLMLNWRASREGPDFQIQYLNRSQRYEGGSWWSQFAEDLHAVQFLRGSARWSNAKGIGGELRGLSTFVDTYRQNTLGAAFLAPHLRLGVAVGNGDAGEQIRLYGDVNWTYAHELDLAAGASFADYALVEDPTSAEDRELTSYFARAGYRVTPGVELSTELQVIENPFYKSDVRFLVGLDLMATGGASRVGIGSGGGH